MSLGTVSLKDYDLGLIKTLGASLIDVQIDGVSKKAYAKKINGVSPNVEGYGDSIPVFFQMSEDVFNPYRIPSISIKRTSLEM